MKSFDGNGAVEVKVSSPQSVVYLLVTFQLPVRRLL